MLSEKRWPRELLFALFLSLLNINCTVEVMLSSNANSFRKDFLEFLSWLSIPSASESSAPILFQQVATWMLSLLEEYSTVFVAHHFPLLIGVYLQKRL